MGDPASTGPRTGAGRGASAEPSVGRADRISRLVESLLRSVEEAICAHEWAQALGYLEDVRVLDPHHADVPPLLQLIERHTGDSNAEVGRRFVTVLFADVVNSTGLGERLQLESYAALLRLFEGAARPVIDHYGGHIQSYFGDGLVAYFGYPTAHDDDAQRCVSATLELLGDVRSVAPPGPLPLRRRPPGAHRRPLGRRGARRPGQRRLDGAVRRVRSDHEPGRSAAVRGTGERARRQRRHLAAAAGRLRGPLARRALDEGHRRARPPLRGARSAPTRSPCAPRPPTPGRSSGGPRSSVASSPCGRRWSPTGATVPAAAAWRSWANRGSASPAWSTSCCERSIATPAAPTPSPTPTPTPTWVPARPTSPPGPAPTWWSCAAAPTPDTSRCGRSVRGSSAARSSRLPTDRRSAPPSWSRWRRAPAATSPRPCRCWPGCCASTSAIATHHSSWPRSSGAR